MRENTKWIMLVTAVAFVALMVFEWGMDMSGQSSAQLSGGQLGAVNGEPIALDEYNLTYQNLYEQQSQSQEEALTSAQNRAIEEAAWEQLVMQKLIQQELANRGIAVTEEEIRQAARYSPPPEFAQNEMFLTDGRFDMEKYHQFLASPAVDDRLLLQLEAYYRDAIPRTKLYQQVTAGAYIPDSELWRLWQERNETATVRFVMLDPEELVPDEAVSVSDQEIQAYYRSNRQEFGRPAQARLQIVTLDQAPTPADTAAARERAAEIRRELVAGADFAELAEQESADPGSAAQGGDLGTFTRGQMVPAFEQAVWSLPIGTVSEPVQTRFGFHLIRVESRSGDEARARHILIPIERTYESEDRLLARADSLEDFGEDLPLAEAAERLGLRTRSITLTEDQTFVPGVGPVEEGTEWAFAEAVPGDVSPLFETGQAFYMLELVERAPARTLTLEEATPAIRARLLREAKLERARQIGRGIVDRVRAGAPLEAAAVEAAVEGRDLAVRTTEPFTRLDYVPGIGQGNAAIGTAFGLAEGQTSGVVEADGRLYILRVLEKTEADREAFEAQVEEQRAQVTNALQRARWNQFLEDLMDQAEIIDDRSRVLGPVAAMN